jgi:hypothetical protein
MRGDRFRYAREAIGRLIDRLNPQDETAIYGFNNWPYQITSWTSSHSAVERVLNDLRDQYLIGFMPIHPADGKFHKLQVTVRGCDCHARARAGFVHSR